MLLGFDKSESRSGLETAARVACPSGPGRSGRRPPRPAARRARNVTYELLWSPAASLRAAAQVEAQARAHSLAARASRRYSQPESEPPPGPLAAGTGSELVPGRGESGRGPGRWPLLDSESESESEAAEPEAPCRGSLEAACTVRGLPGPWDMPGSRCRGPTAPGAGIRTSRAESRAPGERPSIPPGRPPP